MAPVPPLLPAEIFRRVLRMAHFDGSTVLFVAAAFGLAAALLHDQTGTVVGVLAAGAGALELHGAGLLRHGEARGCRWLVASQLALLAVILGYAALRLEHVNLAPMESLLTAEQRRVIAQSGLTPAEVLGMTYRLTYVVVCAVSLVYQGGMAVYYFRRRGALAAALSEPGE